MRITLRKDEAGKQARTKRQRGQAFVETALILTTAISMILFIVDMGRSFSEVNLAAIELADNILIVCTSDRVGIRAVTETQRIFRELLRLPGDPLQYVLNHPSPYTSMAPEELEQTLQARFVASIPFGGDAPARAALEGRPVVIRWPNSVVSKSIQSMAVRFEQQVREAFALAAR